MVVCVHVCIRQEYNGAVICGESNSVRMYMFTAWFVCDQKKGGVPLYM